MDYDTQLAEWVKGNPVHAEHGCCPDFSCCKPSLLAPVEVRQKFAAADDKTRTMFLIGFLGAAMAEAGLAKKVYIAGEHEGAGHA